MVFEQIEKLKRDWTDKFVVADTTRPELARFHDLTGRVKTINMNGRALVEFDGNANIGWYDIALDFLKIVDGPQPKSERPAAAKAAAPASKPAAAAKPAAAGKKASTADILAAARAGKPATAGAAPAGGKKMSTADILAAARAKGGTGATAPAAPKAAAPAKAASAPAATPGKKLSTAEILAAARTAKAAPAEAAPPVETETEPASLPEEAALEPPAANQPNGEAGGETAAVKQPAGGPLPTTTAEKIAYCRRVDANG